MAEKWIQSANLKKGRIKRALGVPEDEPIPASKKGQLRAMAEKGGSLGHAAQLALRFMKGGDLNG